MFPSFSFPLWPTTSNLLFVGAPPHGSRVVGASFPTAPPAVPAPCTKYLQEASYRPWFYRYNVTPKNNTAVHSTPTSGEYCVQIWNGPRATGKCTAIAGPFTTGYRGWVRDRRPKLKSFGVSSQVLTQPLPEWSAVASGLLEALFRAIVGV